MQVCTWHHCGSLSWDHATVYKIMTSFWLWAGIAITMESRAQNEPEVQITDDIS